MTSCDCVRPSRSRCPLPVAEREIASIVWHEAGELVDLIYAEGDPDRLVGSQDVVVELAESLDLVSVPTVPGTMRWVRKSLSGP